MKKVNLNELAALQLVFEFISVSELLTAAMNDFSKGTSIKDKDKENADLCYKALESFLK